MADIDDTLARNGTDPDAPASGDPATSSGLADLLTSSQAATPGSADSNGTEAAVAAAPDVTSGLMSELTEAMMAVVGRERDRIGAIVEADAESHLAQAKERAATEAEAFRQVADEDVASIEAWAEAEIERIKEEAATRISDRRADLDAYLVQHEAVLQGELDGIETALAEYKARLQSFLDELQTGGDPAEIADRARSLPKPPALDDVRAVARAEALTRIAEQAMAADEAAAAERAAAGAEASGAAASPFTDVDAATAGMDETTGPEAAVDVAGEAGSAGTDDAPEPAIAGAPGGSPVAWAAEAPAPVGGDGSGGRTGWETDGLESLMGPAPTRVGGDGPSPDRPVAVMDPMASVHTGWETSTEIPAATGWETADASLAPGLETTSESSVATAVAAEPMPDSDFGHPNAAVRLIRSVAPWTAPTHRDDRTDPRHE